MRSLIAKEWRECRALILGFLVLAPAASVALKWLVVGWARTSAEESGAYLLPALFVLFLLGVGSDLMSGDIASGRIRFLAALPVRPAAVWGAKVLFLAGAAVLYLGYATAVEAAILSLAGKDAGGLASLATTKHSWLLMVGAAAGAGTLFFSTLLDRGLAAVLASLVTLGGLALALRAAVKAGIDLSPAGNLPAAAGLVTVAFLAGSFLAFTRGRPHLGSRLRRALLAAAAFLLVLLPPSGVAAARVAAWVSVTPDDADLDLQCIEVSPDGRWALVTATREGAGPLGARADGGLWAVRTADGLVRDLTPFGTGLASVAEAFATGPGRLLLWRVDPAPDGGRVSLDVVVDLERGEVVSTRARTERIHLRRAGPHVLAFETGGTVVRREGRAPLPVPKNQSVFGPANGWAVSLWGHTGKQWVYSVLDVATGDVLPLPGAPLALPSSRDGVAIVSGPLRRVPLAGGAPAAVDVGALRTLCPSPDAAKVLVVSEDRTLLLTPEEAEPRVLPGVVLADPASITWSPDSRQALLADRTRAFVVTLGDDRPAIRPVRLGLPAREPAWFGGDVVLWCDPDGGGLDAGGLDGSLRRLLPSR